jgi:F-type H+-transporting ATPase subunit b
MSHADIQASGNFLVPNATFIVELVLFLIVFGVVAKFVIPRIQGVTGDRRRMVEQQRQDAEEARRQLDAAQKVYRDALSDARAEAARIREAARTEAQRTMDEARTAAQEESARIVARGEEQLAHQRTDIVRSLRSEIGTLAVELSEKIVAEPLADDADVSTTVESFLAGLAADERARTGTES